MLVDGGFGIATFLYIYAYTYKFVYMAHHFLLLRLNPFDLRVDLEGWWFDYSVS